MEPVEFPDTSTGKAAPSQTELTTGNSTLVDTIQRVLRDTPIIGGIKTGDMLYVNASGKLVNFPIGTSGQVLEVTGGIPVWTTFSSSTVSNTTTKARAYNTGGQTIADSILKVVLDAESYDPGNNFDSTTNYLFTAPVAGYYSVMGSVGLTNLSNNVGIISYIYVNGSEVKRSYNYNGSGAASDLICLVSDTLKLAQNDTVGLYANKTTVGGASVLAVSSKTSLAVHLLSV